MNKVIVSMLVIVGLSLADKLYFLDVYGTDCEMCPVAVRKGLLMLKGIKDIKVSDIDFEKNMTKFIILSDNKLTPEEILKNVEETGKIVGKPYRGKITGVKDVK
ncbi:MAG: heavy metal-associated domain-containing protein [Hydrogenobacter sp.]|uniref:heavy-metal-associated domain-containing protein n=1 Tax=Hydrogenobacter thermophilus TaxID=940 RepID=UPI0030F8B6D0